ncbi:MAG: glycosyltransferase family 2 protein, partial [Bacteroidales bacterium]|nr:glycosyltransferase family 2 protein [Bacteroidales bacterium]
VAPGILAVCDRNHGIPAWRDASKSLGKRYEALGRPNGRPLREQFIYDMRAYNILYAIGHFVTMNIRVLIPKRKSI